MPGAFSFIANTFGSLFGLGGSGSGPSESDLQKSAQAQATADAETQAKAEAALRSQAIRRAGPDAQAQVGGSLTDAPFASLTSYIAGAPSNLQEALRALGLDSSPSQPGLTVQGGS